MTNIQTPLKKRTVPSSVIFEDIGKTMVFAASLSKDMSKRPRDDDDISSRISKLAGDMARILVDIGEIPQETDKSRKGMCTILATLHSYQEMFRIKV
jgi:hypothetical protein